MEFKILNKFACLSFILQKKFFKMMELHPEAKKL